MTISSTVTDIYVFSYCKRFDVDGFIPVSMWVWSVENPTVIPQGFHFQYA